MTDKLEEIVDLIREKDNDAFPHVKIYMDIDDNIKIAGNPQGLRLLAAELIEQSLISDQNNLVTHLDDRHFISDSGLVAIETTLLAKETFRIQMQAEEGKTSSTGVGCIVFLLAIVALIIMGIVFLFRLF